MTGLTERVVAAAARTETRALSLGVGRSLLAAAQLLVLLFTSDSALFIEAVHAPERMRCTGIRALSLWCVTGEDGLTAGRIGSIAVLLVVLSGYRPKFTCLPHWYVAFSTSAVIPVPDGGDRILQVTTLLLVPLCLGDDRVWQWTRPVAPMPGTWRGVAFAGQYALRVQLCAIYLSAVTTKLMDPLWRQGSAMFVVAHDPVSGVPGPLLELFGPGLRSYWAVAAATWLVIAVQVLIVILVWAGPRARRAALVLGIGLHAGIVVLMDLPAFGLVMIGVLVIVCGSGVRARSRVETTGQKRE